MKLTTKQLKQMIKEELSSLTESKRAMKKLFFDLKEIIPKHIGSLDANIKKELAGSFGGMSGIYEDGYLDERITRLIDDFIGDVMDDYQSQLGADHYWGDSVAMTKLYNLIETHPMVKQKLQELEPMKEFALKMLNLKHNPQMIGEFEQEILNILNAEDPYGFVQAYELGALL